jgi:hypothetical protein
MTLLITVIAARSTAARAETIPELTAFLAAQIQATDAAIGSSDASGQPAQASFDEDWYYRRFWMRVRVPAGLDLPWIVKIQVIPEIELLWERQYPDGWSTYKP